MATILLEKETLLDTIDKNKIKISALKQQLHDCKFKITALTARLTANFEAQEESVRITAR